jgi:exodeoxyribonuclease VII large subunit
MFVPDHNDMPEKVSDRTIFSLSEVSLSIQKTLTDRYTSSFWIKAEMNKLNHYPQSGHCYPDLVEKTGGKIIAEMRSTIWKDDFARIDAGFRNVLKEPLKDGIKILFCAKIAFSPVYGLSLRILDIDPSWSLGELEKEKQETIGKLKREGLFNVNRSLKLPVLPQRIAVISVQTSKGYADFCKVIEGNGWGYRFFQMLFPALLQGDQAVGSILSQMERIRKVMHHFDAVALIRGGGGDVGLTCYNDYELARAIALFPLPVMTGIGHSTNETVAEMIAFRNAITPTELADFLIQQFHNFSVPMVNAGNIITSGFRGMLLAERFKVLNTGKYFRSVTNSRLAHKRNEIRQQIKTLQSQSVYFLDRLQERHINQHLSLIEKGSVRFLKTARNDLENKVAGLFDNAAGLVREHRNELAFYEKSVDLMNPVHVMNRGYSITRMDGKVLKTVGEIRQGAILETILPDGSILSTVKKVNKTNDND